MLTQPRVARVFHSMLASRVLLHIRAQAGETPGFADGLTELTQMNFHLTVNENE